jgi:hypothetical protein
VAHDRPHGCLRSGAAKSRLPATTIRPSFEWAGADPHGMAKFCDKYEAKQQILAQSYRVPKAMHEIARDVVVRIKNRVQKKYKPAGHNGAVVRFGNDFETSSVKHGDDVLILCRASPQKKAIEEALIASRVPYSMEGGQARPVRLHLGAGDTCAPQAAIGPRSQRGRRRRPAEGRHPSAPNRKSRTKISPHWRAEHMRT